VAKTAIIISVRSADAHGFQWIWRSADEKHRCAKTFVYFYDCVEDARRAGFTVELPSHPSNGGDGERPHGLR
jgi:hypothetical protein